MTHGNCLRIGLQLAGVLLPLASAHADSWGLVVACGEFENPAINPLAGCEADGQLAKRTLVNAAGIPEDHIVLLTTAGPSANVPRRARILQEFNALVRKTKPGDRVVVWISSHGSRVPDVDGDEKAGVIPFSYEAQYDEVWLAHDAFKEQKSDFATYVQDLSRKRPNAPMTPTEVGDFFGCVIDDEVRDWLTKLEGRRVVVVADTCHSGTSTRGLELQARRQKFVRVPNLPERSVGALLRDLPSSWNVVAGSESPPHILISACLPHQTTVDWSFLEASGWVDNGLLTYAVCLALGGAADADRDGQTTWAETHDFLRMYMRSQLCGIGVTPSVEFVNFGNREDQARSARLFWVSGSRLEKETVSPRELAPLRLWASRSSGEQYIELPEADAARILALPFVSRVPLGHQSDGYLLVKGLQGISERLAAKLLGEREREFRAEQDVRAWLSNNYAYRALGKWYRIEQPLGVRISSASLYEPVGTGQVEIPVQVSAPAHLAVLAAWMDAGGRVECRLIESSDRPESRHTVRFDKDVAGTLVVKVICSDRPVVEGLRSYLDDDADVDLVSFMTDVFLGRIDLSGFSLGTVVIN